jgi:hypothetical protein
LSDQLRDIDLPPDPPEMQRKFKLYPYQYLAIPVLFLIPLLALLGIFGSTTERVHASSEDLDLNVEYTTRDRYRVRNKLNVEVQNNTGESIDTLNIHFGRSYIDRFVDIAFTPDVEDITDTAYIVALEDVQPGEIRIITINLVAEGYGPFSGTVRAVAEGIVPVEVNLATILYP